MLLRGGRCVDGKGRHVILFTSVLNRNSECSKVGIGLACCVTAWRTLVEQRLGRRSEEL